MNKADCFHLGKIAKLHGFKGEVSLFLDVTNPSDYYDLKHFFIDLNNQLTPFFVTQLRPKQKGFVSIKLEGVETEEMAKQILRKDVFLPLTQLPKLEGNDFYDFEVEGFTVFDVNYGEVGKLEMIVDSKTNPLIQVFSGEKEVLIPLSKENIIKVDREAKELHVKAPEGLIELYLD